MDGMPRHSFSRTSRVSNPNVFSDEYSLEPIDPDHIDRAPSPVSISSSTTLRSSNHPQKTVSTATTENENPFGDDARVSFDEPHRSSLPQKGMGGFSTNRNSVNSINNAPSQRNQSVSSRFSIPRAMSPYTGATGPSHPYAMYPQVGVSRTPSVGSTSTIRQHDRPLGESNGPQHPYAMYPQNVVEEGMDDNMIPVGFPGLHPQYQPPPGRRADDVGDIIGPDGHTEPLPPYSRYPTGVIPKPPGAEVMADINPPPESHPPLSISREQPPVSETSSRPLVADHTGNPERNEEQQAPVTGVMVFEEKLKRKGKQTACCGLPIWTLVLIATVMLIGGSIGGVIGGVLGTKKAAEAQRQAQAQSSGPHIVTVTASPELDYFTMSSTPANLKPVPTGKWLVPSVLRNYSRMCVEDNDLNKAWACMDQSSDFEFSVQGNDGHHSVVFATNTPSSTFTYGAQPPLLPSPTQNVSLAIDTTDPSMGPALFFYALFNKLVILPDQAFSSSSVSARSYNPGDSAILDAFASRNEVAQPGEKPWFCWWNSTMMEFFLYVNQSSTDTWYGSTATTENNMPASTATSQAQSKRGDILVDYPRKIKIEERRDYSGTLEPYCQQMEVMSDGQLVPLTDQVINIKEIQPTPTTTYINTAGGPQQTYTAKAQYATPCYCLSLSD